ncbi:cytochrome C biosynthesis protein [Maridesulfovibrio sp. FT414]
MEQIFITVNHWMDGGVLVGALGCFLWGMVSVLFSPCHLASIPLIVGYVAGQDKIIEGRQASLYAILFTSGLFITIAFIGIVCSFLGRMLGDIGSYWTIVVGMILLWVALDMLGVSNCSISGGLMAKLKVKGMLGAFIIGLAYGVLSGSCTFGFIAPVLAIITVQKKIIIGVIFIILFGMGHCLPIAVAGSSAATVRKIITNSTWQRGGILFRRLAGGMIGLLAIYFIVQPFMTVS